ncbi:MAG TPA: mechanosensitive ion channel family protein [Steroidobacteraceae bacterium]|nr:mechanosensitive ion channel family protein [Steroidobacteraceae bacterium]
MADFLRHYLGLSQQVFYGNSLTDWVTAGLLAAAVWVGLSIVRHLIVSRSRSSARAARATPLRLILHLLAGTRQFLLVALALYAGQGDLAFPPKLQHIVDEAVLMAILLQLGLWAVRALKFYLQLKELERGPDHSFAGSLNIIDFVAQMLIWSLLTLVALENVGINITALLAGLGVGGVAVALALQNVLGDLFASLSIALDKPFVVGDRLTIDAFSGVVERIGIKSTRVRSDAGEQIILSNADILKSRVRNYGRAPEQRALAVIRVPYATGRETLHAIPKLLESIVREQPNARFERCHLKSLDEGCLQFELSYFVQQPKINSLLDLQQSVNFRIIDEFRRLGVEFAHPTQRVVVESPRFASIAPAEPRSPAAASRNNGS